MKCQQLLYNYPEKDERIKMFNILTQNTNFSKCVGDIIYSIIWNDFYYINSFEPRDDNLSEAFWNQFQPKF